MPGTILHGFYAHLEYDTNTGLPELRLLLDEDTGLTGLAVHIGAWSLLEAVDRAVQETTRISALHDVAVPERIGPGTIAVADRITGMMSLLLYLCSENSEIRNQAKPGARPGRPQPTKTKRGWRLFQAKAITIWDIGAETEQLGADGDGFWLGSVVEDGYRYRWMTGTGGS